MTQIIVSPSEMRAFAKQLVGLVEEMRGQEGKLQNDIADLSSTWRDQKYREFKGAWEEMRVQLQSFYSISLRYVSYLDQKARAAERYLND